MVASLPFVVVIILCVLHSRGVLISDLEFLEIPFCGDCYTMCSSAFFEMPIHPL
jgi:hypothetical protein